MKKNSSMTFYTERQVDEFHNKCLDSMESITILLYPWSMGLKYLSDLGDQEDFIADLILKISFYPLVSDRFPIMHGESNELIKKILRERVMIVINELKSAINGGNVVKLNSSGFVAKISRVELKTFFT